MQGLCDRQLQQRAIPCTRDCTIGWPAAWRGESSEKAVKEVEQVKVVKVVLKLQKPVFYKVSSFWKVENLGFPEEN